MIHHELITLDTDGRVDVHLPDGATIRFAGIALAEEWLDWADVALGESNHDGSNCRHNQAAGIAERAGSLVAGRFSDSQAPH